MASGARSINSVPTIRLLVTALGLLVLLGGTLSCRNATQAGGRHIVLVAAGDVLGQRDIKRAAVAYAREAVGNDGWDGLLADVRSLVRSADVAFCNLETPLLERAGTPGGPVEHEDEFPKFFAPSAIVRALRDAGFGVVSVANNHAHDMGAGGVEGTVQALRGLGLQAVGVTVNGTPEPPMVKVGQWPIRFVGATLKMNKTLPAGFTPYGVQQVDPQNVAPLVSQVRSARHAGEECVVSLHWGTEWGTEPDSWQRTIAHRLCEEGAVLVLAHHAHVAQALEVYRAKDGRRCLIAWCLGNLVGIEPRHVEANLGMLVRVGLDDDGHGRLQVTECNWQPTWALREDERVHVVPLDAPSDLARRALGLAECRAQLHAAEKRIGPRVVPLP